MENIVKKITVIILFLTSVHLGFAQEKRHHDFLYQIGIKDSLFSEILHEQRDIWVHLPEGFDPSKSTKYPVVYILDGSVQMKALAAVCDYYWGYHLPKMILVGISNQTHRTRDLTTSKVTWRNGGQMNAKSGEAEVFTQFIEKELIPYVDNHYPTTPYRTLIGHSYAGLFCINTLVNHPQLFQNYMAIDPSLDWDNQKLLKQAEEDLHQKDFNGKSLFVSMSAGQLHMLDGSITIGNVEQDTSEYTLFPRSIIEFSKYAASQKQNGLNFSWKYYLEDLHGTVPLPSIRDGLIFLFKWYEMVDPEKFNNPATPIDTLVKILKGRTEKLSVHFGYSCPPIDEEQLSMLGYMAFQFGQPDKAYAFLKMHIDYYPESASGYDAMSQYYEAMNDMPNALEYVTKAFEISGDDQYKQRMKALKAKK